MSTEMVIVALLARGSERHSAGSTIGESLAGIRNCEDYSNRQYSDSQDTEQEIQLPELPLV